MEKAKQFYEKQKGQVVKGEVRGTQSNEKFGGRILLLSLEGGVLGIITEEELDAYRVPKSFTIFLGETFEVEVIGVDDEGQFVMCSRKNVQEKKKGDFIASLEDNPEKILKGEVVNKLKYGVYVEVNGVHGLLRNDEFSNGLATPSEVLEVGEEVEVKISKVSKNGKVYFKMAEKFNDEVSDLEFSLLEEDQVIVGVVKTIKTQGVFVGLIPGLDGLCPQPPESVGMIMEGSKVGFRIMDKQDGEYGKRVRGRIVRVID